jgi:alpha-L-arabinofuranosidase
MPGGVDVLASVSGAGDEVVVTLVNTSPDEGRDIDVSLRNAGGIAQTKGTLLASTSFLPESEFTEQSLPVTPAGVAGVSVKLPPHSVARIEVRCQGG